LIYFFDGTMIMTISVRMEKNKPRTPHTIVTNMPLMPLRMNPAASG
jgi:hypothetical protein